jgi:hypothetical protein
VPLKDEIRESVMFSVNGGEEMLSEWRLQQSRGAMLCTDKSSRHERIHGKYRIIEYRAYLGTR